MALRRFLSPWQRAQETRTEKLSGDKEGIIASFYAHQLITSVSFNTTLSILDRADVSCDIFCSRLIRFNWKIDEHKRRSAVICIAPKVAALGYKKPPWPDRPD